MKTDQMITRKCMCYRAYALWFRNFIYYNSGSLLASNIQANPDIGNKLNIMSHELSFANGSDHANQSSKDMTMMKMMERGDIAMGFNQNKIIHQFVATPAGDEIIITAENGSDRQTINQINNHIAEIQKEFSEGNFTKPFFIHAQEVPGTSVMSEKKELIKYEVLQMKNVSTLLLTTHDGELINAISQFMEFQAREHHDPHTTNHK